MLQLPKSLPGIGKDPWSTFPPPPQPSRVATTSRHESKERILFLPFVPSLLRHRQMAHKERINKKTQTWSQIGGQRTAQSTKNTKCRLKNLRRLTAFKYFNLYYGPTILQCLVITFSISSSSESEYIKLWDINNEDLRSRHVYNCRHITNISKRQFVLCLWLSATAFHIHPYIGSLLTTIKPETKHRFRAVAMLLFYVLQKQIS
jgi:hypothetical protein